MSSFLASFAAREWVRTKPKKSHTASSQMRWPGVDKPRSRRGASPEKRGFCSGRASELHHATRLVTEVDNKSQGIQGPALASDCADSEASACKGRLSPRMAGALNNSLYGSISSHTLHAAPPVEPQKTHTCSPGHVQGPRSTTASQKTTELSEHEDERHSVASGASSHRASARVGQPLSRNQLQQMIEEGEHELENAQARIQTLELQNATLQQRLSDADSNVRALSDELQRESLRERMSSATQNASRAEYDSQMQELQEKLKTVARENHDLGKSKQALENEVTVLKSKLNEKSVEVDLLHESYEVLFEEEIVQLQKYARGLEERLSTNSADAMTIQPHTSPLAWSPGKQPASPIPMVSNQSSSEDSPLRMQIGLANTPRRQEESVTTAISKQDGFTLKSTLTYATSPVATARTSAEDRGGGLQTAIIVESNTAPIQAFGVPPSQTGEEDHEPQLVRHDTGDKKMGPDTVDEVTDDISEPTSSHLKQYQGLGPTPGRDNHQISDIADASQTAPTIIVSPQLQRAPFNHTVQSPSITCTDTRNGTGAENAKERERRNHAARVNTQTKVRDRSPGGREIFVTPHASPQTPMRIKEVPQIASPILADVEAIGALTTSSTEKSSRNGIEPSTRYIYTAGYTGSLSSANSTGQGRGGLVQGAYSTRDARARAERGREREALLISLQDVPIGPSFVSQSARSTSSLRPSPATPSQSQCSDLSADWKGAGVFMSEFGENVTLC